MGHRITRAASHVSTDEVKERMKTERRPWVRQHWWIIYNALVAPRKADEIALHTGVSATTVHRVIARYNRLGPAAIEQSAKGGRHHEYLTLEQEQAFLQPFFARAERGEIATVEQISRPLKQKCSMKSMSTPSTVSCIDMAGASWLLVRVIPRPTRKNRPRFKKKLPARGPGSSEHARAHR